MKDIPFSDDSHFSSLPETVFVEPIAGEKLEKIVTAETLCNAIVETV